jgi:hypothetical protein
MTIEPSAPTPSPMSVSPPTSGSTPVSRLGASAGLGAGSAPAGELAARTATRTAPIGCHAVCSRPRRRRKNKQLAPGQFTGAHRADRIPPLIQRRRAVALAERAPARCAPRHSDTRAALGRDGLREPRRRHPPAVEHGQRVTAVAELLGDRGRDQTVPPTMRMRMMPEDRDPGGARTTANAAWCARYADRSVVVWGSVAGVATSSVA